LTGCDRPVKIIAKFGFLPILTGRSKSVHIILTDFDRPVKKSRGNNFDRISVKIFKNLGQIFLSFLTRLLPVKKMKIRSKFRSQILTDFFRSQISVKICPSFCSDLSLQYIQI